MQDTPTDLLAHLLHHVGQGDRLSSCALVEKRWRQAAMMATKSIACTATSGPALQNLSAWLDSNIHATRIKEIQVEDKASIYFWVRPAVQLPIWKLTQLEVLQLISCNLMVTSAQPSGLVTTPAASSQSGSLSALTALSRLVLKDTLLDLSTIGSLVTLQHLSLCRVGHVEEECLAITTAASEGEQQEIPYNEVYDSSSIWLPQLAQLTRLTYLAVEYSPFELPRQPAASAITACLSSLQGLQRLELNISGLEAADLAHLPTCLTALSLSELPEISVKVLPCMQQLTHLQSLQLVNSKQVDPVVLSNLVQLTDLRITSSRLLDATAKQSLEHGLMAALQHMTQMQHLELSSSLLEVTRQPDLYAALTASTELRHLNLIDCKLLAGASKYIFPATGSHPALQVVIIGADLLSSHGDFGRLVCCCPSLRHLEVVSEPWADAYAVQVPYQVWLCLRSSTRSLVSIEIATSAGSLPTELLRKPH